MASELITSKIIGTPASIALEMGGEPFSPPGSLVTGEWIRFPAPVERRFKAPPDYVEGSNPYAEGAWCNQAHGNMKRWLCEFRWSDVEPLMPDIIEQHAGELGIVKDAYGEDKRKSLLAGYRNFIHGTWAKKIVDSVRQIESQVDEIIQISQAEDSLERSVCGASVDPMDLYRGVPDCAYDWFEDEDNHEGSEQWGCTITITNDTSAIQGKALALLGGATLSLIKVIETVTPVRVVVATGTTCLGNLAETRVIVKDFDDKVEGRLAEALFALGFGPGYMDNYWYPFIQGGVSGIPSHYSTCGGKAPLCPYWQVGPVLDTQYQNFSGINEIGTLTNAARWVLTELNRYGMKMKNVRLGQ